MEIKTKAEKDALKTKAVELLVQFAEVSGYQIEQDTEITEATISNLRNGKTRPHLKNAVTIIDYFENKKYLKDKKDCPEQPKNPQVRTAFPQNGFKMIENEEALEAIPEEFRKWMKPFYPDIKIGAGMEMGVCHGRSKYFILVPNSERVEFWATVEGHSMYPKYGQNDLVGLAYTHLDAVFGGHNYVVELKSGSAHLKRVDFIKGKNDTVNLHSYNPDFDDKEMELDKIQNFFKVCMHIGFE